MLSNLSKKNSNVKQIGKSRYDSISCYISPEKSFREDYNDIPLPIDEDTFKLLRSAGIDERLARHYSHLYIRDPLVIYSMNLLKCMSNSLRGKLGSRRSAIEFSFRGMFGSQVSISYISKNIQSTNWQTVRFKPPHPSGNTGWRVEFR
jgi:glutamate--cysteine ligase catalytic subunit